MDIKGEINKNAVIVGDFNTPLTSMGRSSRQKINKDTAFLNNTLDQMGLVDIFSTFHPIKQNIHTTLSILKNQFKRT